MEIYKKGSGFNQEELNVILEKQLFTSFCPKMVESATRIAEELICGK